MRISPSLTSMVLAVLGRATKGGTWAAVMAGAAPGWPPRGVVRTTWLAGSAVLQARRRSSPEVH